VSTNQTAVILVRILRDLCHRITTWQPLGQWASLACSYHFNLIVMDVQRGQELKIVRMNVECAVCSDCVQFELVSLVETSDVCERFLQ